MKNPYLEVTFRHGRPLAAYYYLSRRPGEKSYRTAKAQPGLVIDFNRSGQAHWHRDHSARQGVRCCAESRLASP